MGTLGRRPVLAGAAGVGAALLAACGGGASGGGTSANVPTDVKETITLIATDFAYQPAQIRMPGLGQLTITLENKGLVDHDFVIEGVNGPKLIVKPKETGKATFTITKAGKFNIGCSVQGHKEAGMKGTLVVG